MGDQPLPTTRDRVDRSPSPPIRGSQLRSKPPCPSYPGRALGPGTEPNPPSGLSSSWEPLTAAHGRLTQSAMWSPSPAPARDSWRSFLSGRRSISTKWQRFDFAYTKRAFHQIATDLQARRNLFVTVIRSAAEYLGTALLDCFFQLAGLVKVDLSLSTPGTPPT